MEIEAALSRYRYFFQLTNIDDSRVVVAPQRALLGNLLQYEIHLNLTSSAFTEIFLVQVSSSWIPIPIESHITPSISYGS